MTISQCSAGIWNFILKEDNTILKNRKVLGIDIGFETTDIAIMNGISFEDANSFTLPVGISDYNQKIVQDLNNKFGVKKSLEDVDVFIKEGKFGNNDISNIINSNYKKLVKEVIDGITLVAPSTFEFTDIILMGGGGIKTIELFKDYEDFKNTILLDKPQLANVFGSRKLSKLVWRDRNYANV
jgi:cell division ATPase FtsA